MVFLECSPSWMRPEPMQEPMQERTCVDCEQVSQLSQV